jgi:transposase
MPVKRRVYGAAFKAKVALVAANGDRTTGRLASQFEIHSEPGDGLEEAAHGPGDRELFADARQRRADQATDELDLDEQIGRLKMEVEW